MSRKSDIELVKKVWQSQNGGNSLTPALSAAWDLGRAEQAEKDLSDLNNNHWAWCQSAWMNIPKRLRAKVRKAAGK